ncbi:hypothetical protein [Oryzifoliimicrobium ureilyticus]|uniref:hypothetical protein n=1 Tax=Oryzifoliimicrobium ureilyticus TaxID=3113724 RepID=UPI003075F9D6
MTPDNRREIFSHRDEAAVIKGISQDDGSERTITDKSLGEAIVFVSEQAATDAATAYIVYGQSTCLSYTDCLSVYRDYGAVLRQAQR